MKSKILLGITFVLLVSLVFSGSAFGQSWTSAVDSFWTSGSKQAYWTAGTTSPDSMTLRVTVTQSAVATVDTILFYFPPNVATSMDTLKTRVTVEGAANPTLDTIGWMDLGMVRHLEHPTTIESYNDEFGGAIETDFNVFRIVINSGQAVTGDIDIMMTFQGFKYPGAFQSNISRRSGLGLTGSSNKTVYTDTIAIVVIDDTGAGSQADADSASTKLHMLPGAVSTVTATLAGSGATNDTVGIPFEGRNAGTNNLIVVAVDAYGNKTLDSTTTVYAKPSNSSGTVVPIGGGKFLAPFYDRSSSAQKDTLVIPWDAANAARVYDINQASYTKAVQLYFKVWFGSKTDITSNSHVLYETTPYELTVAPTTHADVEVVTNTGVFTVTVKDTFNNVCRKDSVYMSSHRGEAVIEYATTEAFTSPTSLHNGTVYYGYAPLDNSGKVYIRATAGSYAATDSLIFQAYDQAPTASDNSAILNTTLTRKGVEVVVVAGDIHSIALYPEATDLADQTAGDYYNPASGFDVSGTLNQGKVMAGDSVHFRILLRDQYGNQKDATSSDFSNTTITAKRNGGAICNEFIDSSTKSSNTNFSVDMIGFRYKTSTTATGDFWVEGSPRYIKDTVSVTYSGISNPSDNTEFETKGGFPSDVAFYMSNGTLQTGTPTDTVQVDSMYTVMVYLWDDYGNYADTLRTITFEAGLNTQYTKNLTDNDGFYNVAYGSKTEGDAAISVHSFTGVKSTDKDSTTHINKIFNGTSIDSVGALAFFKSDSAKGTTYIKVKYGSTVLDSLKLIKHPMDISTLDVKFVREDGSEVDADTTSSRSESGALIAGQDRTAKIKFYDAYDNVVVVPADSERYTDGFIHRGNLGIGRLMADTILTTAPYDQELGYFEGRPYPDYSIYPSTYNLIDSSAYVTMTFTTIGGDSGRQYIDVSLSSTRAGHYITGPIVDTLIFRTWLPNVLSQYTITSTISEQLVGQKIKVVFEPEDADGNPIYAFKYKYFEVTLLDDDGNAVFDTTVGAVEGGNREYVSWTSHSSNTVQWADSINSIGYSSSHMAGATANNDTMFTLNADTFEVAVTKTITGAQVKVYSVSLDDYGVPNITHTQTKDLDLDWYPDAPDTVIVTASGNMYAQTKSQMTVVLKDQYLNTCTDSSYVTKFYTNMENIDVLTQQIIIDGQGSVLDVVPYEAGTLKVRAELIENADDGATTNAFTTTGRGFGLASFTVAAASISAPTSLVAADNPNDNGGYVLLSWTASDNHYGAGSDNNLNIDYYQIYRASTNDLTTAVNWAVVPATPVSSGTGTTIRAVVSTRGDNSTNAYYWVAAVKGELPVGMSSSVIEPTIGKFKEMGYLVGYEVEAKAANVSATYAVETDVRLTSSADGPNRAIGAVNSSLTADFNSDGTVGLPDLSLFAWAYGYTAEYDLLFDLDANVSVGLGDLSLFAAQYGTSLNSNSLMISSGINIDAAVAASSNSEGSDKFDITVDLTAVSKMAGYEFALTYDPNVYKFTGANHTDFINANGGASPVQIVKEEEGRVVLANVVTDGKYAVDGEGSLATVSFEWIGDKVTEMTVEGIIVMDDNGRMNALDNVVIEKPVVLPDDYALEQNYPNPFNPETTIKYALPVSGKVKMLIYNVLGQKVRTLVDTDMKAGVHKVVWDGRNDHGVKVASGMYIYMVKASDFTANKKMVLLK